MHIIIFIKKKKIKKKNQRPVKLWNPKEKKEKKKIVGKPHLLRQVEVA